MPGRIRSLFNAFGIDVHRHVAPAPSDDAVRALQSLQWLRERSGDAAGSDEQRFLGLVAELHRASKAQLFQDLFVLHETGRARAGFFVEFGAADGVELSNTWLLEAEFGWTGILAEPARHWHERLRRNRRCACDTRCVWSSTGHTLPFNETPQAELSTLDAFSSVDEHASRRAHGKRYPVQTVSLDDLLDEHQAPAVIDYLSVDTEGSELEILSAFDFSRHAVRVITVEHNRTPARQDIFELLTSKGFVRKFAALSAWDDWYVAAAGRP